MLLQVEYNPVSGGYITKCMDLLESTYTESEELVEKTTIRNGIGITKKESILDFLEKNECLHENSENTILGENYND